MISVRARVAGFTLLELVVALFLTSLVALLGREIVGGIIAGGEVVARSRTSLDRRMNGLGWMMEALTAVDASAGSFEGGAGSLAFTARMPVAGGWNEQRRMTLALTHDTLLLEGEGMAVPVMTGIAALRCDFLVTEGLDARFVAEWTSPLGAPSAVRLRLDRVGGGSDTLLVALGVRG